MFSIFDHLTASIVGAVVLLIIFSMHQRSQEMSVDQTVTYMARKQALEFGWWLQRDLSNIGWGVAPAQRSQRLSSPSDDAGNTTSFSFLRKINATDAAPSRIVYELQPADTVAIDGAQIPLYEMRRCISATTCDAGTQSGSSGERLTAFRVELLDANGAAAGTSTAEQVRVSFSMALPYAEDRPRAYLRETHWATTLPLK